MFVNRPWSRLIIGGIAISFIATGTSTIGLCGVLLELSFSPVTTRGTVPSANYMFLESWTAVYGGFDCTDCRTVLLLMFLRILMGLLRRNVPKIYSTGGQCEWYFLFTQGTSLLIIVTMKGKSSQPPPFIVAQTPQSIQTAASTQV
jgi:hypothetical protein